MNAIQTEGDESNKKGMAHTLTQVEKHKWPNKS